MIKAQGPTGPPGVGRHKSDVSDRRAEPPLCVQNAMLTKDKKPFTYTPGGIDLSEIKSPRMARRIERNAMAPGVGDVIQPLPPQGPVGPLPPSALAAMQPALPVQVFPSGPPPPPIPAPVNIPPPPPPMMPLPTKPVATSDGVYERPDMTKIIPENPMALLRKTPGVNRRSFVEEPDYPPVRQQHFEEAPAPQYSQTQVQMQPQRPQSQFSQPKAQPQMVIQPQFDPSPVPVQDSLPEVKTSTAQLGSLYIPPLNVQEAQQKTPPAAPQKKIQTPEQSPESPQSPLATLNRAPRPWQNQKSPQQELPAWAQRSQSPPPGQQQSPPINAQSERYSPPPPQQQQQQQKQIPGSPVPQQPRLIQQVRPPQQPPAQPTIVGRVIIPVQMEAPPAQNSKNSDAVFVTQPVILQHPGPRPEANVNQQQRFVQPNQAPQQQKVVQPPQPVKSQGDTAKGTRIIPIQIEGASNANVQRQDSKFSTPGTTPATPGSARPFTRQPSWSSTPTQSNSFKVIQKITNTDGDEDDDDQATTEHSPKNSQHFQQVPADQLRKMKLNESDRDLMNKIKQGVDEENSIHKEADPRYRGATIPSKAFRFLQSMTDGSDADAVSASVPRSSQNSGGGSGSNRTPQVRTIPVQIEGENSGKPYVPPSEQTVQEPKKYTGSAIPSRSFKILQAMTGDTCADVGQANETNENYRFDPSYYWGYNPGFMPMPPPMPLPPYWQYYCSPSPTPSSDTLKDTEKASSRNTPVVFKSAIDRKQKSNYDSESSESSSTRNTPLPFWNCKQTKDNASTNFESERPPRNTPLPFWNYRQSPSRQTKQNAEADYQSDHSRCTPLPFWNYCPSPVQYPKQKSNVDTDSESDLPRNTPLPFWNYYPQYAKHAKTNGDTDSESELPRTTPLPFWGCYSPFYPIPYSNNETDSESEQLKSNRTTPAVDQDNSYNENETHPQFWSPYSYYPYFYGYPPPPPLMYPYPFYPPMRNDTDEITGYSSTDEMAYYNSKSNREKTCSLTPTPTPTQQKTKDKETDTYEEGLSSTEDESETEVEEEHIEEEPRIQRNLSLQAIKSVSDINVYNTDDPANCTDDEGDNISEVTTTDDNDDVSVYTEEEEEEAIPHQLSVIYEESERSDASRMIRESSVATTVSVETVTMCTVEDLDQELQYPIISEPEEEQKCQVIYSVMQEYEEQEEDTVVDLTSPITRSVMENYAEEEFSSAASPIINASPITENNLEIQELSSDLITPHKTESFNNEIEETKSEKSTSSSEDKDWWSLIGKNEEEIYNKKIKVANDEVTEIIENKISESNAFQDDDSVDFWKIIESSEPRQMSLEVQSSSEAEKLDYEIPATLDKALIHEAPESEINDSNRDSSTSSSDSSSVCSESSKVSEKLTVDMEECPTEKILEVNDVKMPSIKDRIRALQEASKNRFDLPREENTINAEINRINTKQETFSVKEEISQFNSHLANDKIKETSQSKSHEAEATYLPSENEFKANQKQEIDYYESPKTKSLSTKSSVKSFEDISEDEMDSGVTSDVSRHISDNESDFPELKKMTKYQRAATHSRLFKLLQEECEQEENNDEESIQESPALPAQTVSMERKNAILKEQLEKEKLNEEILIRRESLSLPLNNKNNSESDSFSSSGINSPGSPVINERLVNELVHSLLRRKKGHIFRNMSMEKLHSAAIRILQEELDSSSTSYDEFLSPIKSCSSPQEFHTNYTEYTQYYDSWSEAERLYQASYDILPSKTFKLIQEQAVMNKTGSISGFLARCPRVLSSKNVHKELISVLESRESPIPNSEVETKGAASAS